LQGSEEVAAELVKADSYTAPVFASAEEVFDEFAHAIEPRVMRLRIFGGAAGRNCTVVADCLRIIPLP